MKSQIVKNLEAAEAAGQLVAAAYRKSVAEETARKELMAGAKAADRKEARAAAAKDKRAASKKQQKFYDARANKRQEIREAKAKKYGRSTSCP